MAHWIATPHQAMRLVIPVMKMINPPSPKKMMKAETAPSESREKIDSTVADID